MNYAPCPHCGASMWLEMGRTVLRHPVPSDCILAGRAFRVTRKNARDRRPTWEEYVAKHESAPAPTSAPAPKLPPAE